MTTTATTHRPHTPTGRRRVPAALALAMAAGVALSACSADPDDEPTTPPAPVTSTSSSSTPSPTTPPADTVTPASAPTTSAVPAPPAPAPQLPANVVGSGGPCQMLGEVAQGEDGSALFCTEDPRGAGPLWLPLAGSAPDPGEGGGLADATGQPRPGGPCTQEGLAVTGLGGTVLTCRLTGGGDVPGGLYWQ
ncbi:hypothetical protein [Dietzia sp. CH92]|uniref:hypothetical protein n=1 Tax=Dietzia sp. CH92 TaxID=3051823 RepID=UPI0028D40389|nr:hypothetical protein [Dietzia sp. CH92]